MSDYVRPQLRATKEGRLELFELLEGWGYALAGCLEYPDRLPNVDNTLEVLSTFGKIWRARTELWPVLHLEGLNRVLRDTEGVRRALQSLNPPAWMQEAEEYIAWMRGDTDDSRYGEEDAVRLVRELDDAEAALWTAQKAGVTDDQLAAELLDAAALLIREAEALGDAGVYAQRVAATFADPLPCGLEQSAWKFAMLLDARETIERSLSYEA